MELAQLASWTPMCIAWEQGRPVVDWCYLGTQRFVEPLFDQTIEKCLRLPFNLLFRQQTPIEVLDGWRAVRPGLPPTGFIFHMSQCGSTLASQLLAALPQNIVISEAGLLDAVLRANSRDPGISDEQRVTWLRALVTALGQRRNLEETRFFIKFDSWSTLDLPLIQRAFPDVPWVFMYRNPVEVLVSQLRQRGARTAPGLVEPARFGLDAPAAAAMPPMEYSARVLAKICQAALEHARCGNALFVNYRQLPEAVWSSIADHFRIAFPAADLERMRQAAQFDAKNPSLYFEEDATRKDCEATGQVRESADRWLQPLYEQLEARANFHQ